MAPNCLLCHAETYQPDDLLASAHTTRAAGGQTCLRCHSNYPKENIHASVGLACVSCHISTQHQIQTQVACQTCHLEKPHLNPFINTKHERLDCRTCHITEGGQITVDPGQVSQNRLTGYFEPQVEKQTGAPTFAWQTLEGQPASIDTAGAVIVPVRPVTILAPQGFDPSLFALTGDGQGNGSSREISAQLTLAHDITKEGARTCANCHGPEGDFDFAGLGYDEEKVSNLSLKPAEAE
jgi:hypothetical protein